jgi:hypothetical protein
VNWTTTIPTTGALKWSPATQSPSTLAYDGRGAATVSTIHSVTVTSLLPATRYLFDVVSGDGTDTNGGLHYPVLTGSSLAIPASDMATGKAISTSGGSPGSAIIIMTVESPGDGGSSAISMLVRASDAGNWLLNLTDLRTITRDAYYPLTASTTVLVEAIGGEEGYARNRFTVTQARAGTSQLVMAQTLQASSSLRTGWNLVALSLDPVTPMTASTLCASLAGLLEIDRWDGGWDGHLCAIPSNDFPIELGRGYFLRVSGALTWSYNGLPIGSRLAFPLQSGWNLVGFPGAANRFNAPGIVASIALAAGATSSTVAEVIREVDRWEDGQWQGYIVGVPIDQFTIDEGRGYFMRLNRPVTWTIPALTGTNRVSDPSLVVPSVTLAAPTFTATAVRSATTVVVAATASPTATATATPSGTPSGVATSELATLPGLARTASATASATATSTKHPGTTIVTPSPVLTVPNVSPSATRVSASG